MFAGVLRFTSGDVDWCFDGYLVVQFFDVGDVHVDAVVGGG